jgi:hypothetical protein
MSTKRSIKTKDIVNDFRAGMSNAALMEKYQISPRSLEEIFSRLVAAEALMEIELVGRVPVSRNPETPSTVVSSEAARVAKRSYVMVNLPVYDLDDLTVEGYVEDISETGLLVSGIQVNVGDGKSLLIQADEFGDVYPFTFDVVCRRLELQPTGGGFAAGFEITSISEVGRQELKKLCLLLGLK